MKKAAIALLAATLVVLISITYLKAKEMLAMRLAVLHNLYFYNSLMEKIRFALENGIFEQFYHEHIVKIARRI